MIDLTMLEQIVRDHGLLVLFPLAVIEGPIVTTIAAWFARQGLLNPGAVFVTCILADIAGDLLYYWLGRHGLPPEWQRRLGLTPARRRVLKQQFRDHGPRHIVLGKLTHSAGIAVLMAAGASRMKMTPFLGWCLVATLPKTALFMAIGWVFGGRVQRVDDWIAQGSAIMLGLLVAFGLLWLLRRKFVREDTT